MRNNTISIGATARQSKRARRAQKLYTSEVAETCRLCPTPIAPGEKFVRGLTKEPYHRLCKRLLRPQVQVRPLADSPVKLSPVTRSCVGCSDVIRSDEKSTSLQGAHWHKVCFLRERRRM